MPCLVQDQSTGSTATVMDQAFVSPQERLQTVRATRLGASKNIHSSRVANGYNIHSDVSFQDLEYAYPYYPARRRRYFCFKYG